MRQLVQKFFVVLHSLKANAFLQSVWFQVPLIDIPYQETPQHLIRKFLTNSFVKFVE